VEVHGNVDAREEGFIEGFDTVGGQEEDATIVFDVTEAEAILSHTARDTYL
jgi:hypothetical protein